MPTPSSGSLLTATNLGRKHPSAERWLFRRLDLDLQIGDRMALVGPTGSGKSLILRAASLLDPVDEGEILWRRRPIADAGVPEFRSRVLYLHQRSPVIEGSVEDNLRLPFQMRLQQGSPFPRDLLDELLERVGWDASFLGHRTANLSGGERQMVAMLRALLATPEVLLLDEPSAALDPEATARLEQMVDTWHRQAPTERASLWVSHDEAQAQRVADRVLRLRQGRLEAGP